jgi:GAG-pre-integrase domain
MYTTLATVVDRVGAGGSGVSTDDELLLIHRRIGHSSFNLLEHLYPLKYEKTNKQKLVCDGCEFKKHTRSSFVSSGSKSSHEFDLIHSDVCGP